jgi:hypothetical protein
LCECRGIVDAVSDHPDPLTFCLQPLYLVSLVAGKDLGEHAVDAKLTSYGFRGPSVVASHHDDLEA